MRALAVVSSIFLVALVAVPVPAQVPVDAPTTLQLTVQPVEGEHAPGEKLTTTVTVEYCYFTAAALAQEPTTVTLEVVEAPEWATARFDPAEVAFPLEPAASQSTCAEPASVVLEVALASDAPADEPATLRVKASAEENPPAAASEAEDAVLVTATRAIVDESAAPANATSGTPPADTPFPTAFAVVGVTLGVAIALAAPARKK